MKTEKEIREKIEFLEKDRRNCTICFMENHGILNAINAYANDKWIDARKLLEMICIVVQSKTLLPIFISENIKNLKDEIIQMTIDAETKFKHNNKIDFKQQIQQLFKD